MSLRYIVLNFIHFLVEIILNFVGSSGYIGIFLMTLIESTFIPIPSEITLVPAGYLLSQGQMHILPLFISSILGTVLGAVFNYALAYVYGRKIILNYGKYFFLTKKDFSILERFFLKYGNISTFFGRMLPGVKHFISFPAGLAGMNIKLFCLYTLAGSSVWIIILLYFGYVIGGNEKLISYYIKRFNLLIVFIFTIFILFFFYKNSKDKK